jgi:hypothetical protein
MTKAEKLFEEAVARAQRLRQDDPELMRGPGPDPYRLPRIYSGQVRAILMVMCELLADHTHAADHGPAVLPIRERKTEETD